MIELQFTAQLWEYQGEAPWVFVTLPEEDADVIEERVPDRRGFGSVKVTVVIGDSEWNTSLFPDKESGSFVLPVKRAIREAEGLSIGESAEITVVIDTE